MTNAELIQAIKAEIERRMIELAKDKYIDLHDTLCRTKELDRLLSFLDTFEEKSEKPTNLEDAVKEYFHGMWPGMDTPEQCNTDLHFTPPAIIRLARHFAEWQKEQDLAEMTQSKSPLSVAYANRCFENGKQAMKEQMLKEAVEGVIIDSGFDDGIAFVTMNIPDRRYDRGDKVRIIVLPNTDEK